MSFFFYFDEHLFIPFFLFLWWAFKSQLFSLPYFNEKTIANGESLSSSHQISISLAYFSPFQASSFLLNGGGRKKRFSRSVINFERERGGENERPEKYIYCIYIYLFPMACIPPSKKQMAPYSALISQRYRINFVEWLFFLLPAWNTIRLRQKNIYIKGSEAI